jgi:hypothetical protein
MKHPTKADEEPLNGWILHSAVILERFSFSYAGSTAMRRTSNCEKPRGLKPAARNMETGNALKRQRVPAWVILWFGALMALTVAVRVADPTG